MKPMLLAAVAAIALSSSYAAAQGGTATPAAPPSPPVAQDAGATSTSSRPSSEERIDRLERAVGGIATILERLERRLEEGRPAATTQPAQPAAAAAPSVAPSPAAQASSRIRLTPGWVVRVFEAERDRIGETDLGEFILSTYPAKMNAHARDVRTQAQVAYRGEALFVAREAGRYTFQVSVNHPGGNPRTGVIGEEFDPNCFVEMKQGQTNIVRANARGSRHDGALSSEAAGTLEVTEPGAIPVTLTVACSLPDAFQNSARVRASHAAQNAKMEFSISIRGPGDRTLRAATPSDFVHRE